jgi:hypothetical protein
VVGAVQKHADISEPQVRRIAWMIRKQDDLLVGVKKKELERAMFL